MDHLTTARQVILEFGSEDYYHLADAAAYLDSVPADERQALAREAMLQLLEEGLVQLFFGRLATNDVTPVPLEAARAILNTPGAWDPEQDVNHQSYAFANTDRGDAVYRSGSTRRA
jgi:hypothetical protein